MSWFHSIQPGTILYSKLSDTLEDMMDNAETYQLYSDLNMIIDKMEEKNFKISKFVVTNEILCIDEKIENCPFISFANIDFFEEYDYVVHIFKNDDFLSLKEIGFIIVKKQERKKISRKKTSAGVFKSSIPIEK
jgi:hypothetical protein